MDFYDVIHSRRTIRNFIEQPVDKEIIMRVLSAGLKAPTHDHLRDWGFVVVPERETIDSILQKIPQNVTSKYVENIIKAWELK